MAARGQGIGTVVLSFAALIIVVMVARMVLVGHRELAAGDIALTRGDVDGAMLHFGRAVRAYVPFGPYAERGAHALIGIAERAHRSADVEREMRAWRTLAAGAGSVRVFGWTPLRPEYEIAARGLRELGVDVGSRSRIGGRHDPAVLASLLAVLGFGVAVFGLGRRAWLHGVGAAVPWKDWLLVGVGFVVFVVGLGLA